MLQAPPGDVVGKSSKPEKVLPATTASPRLNRFAIERKINFCKVFAVAVICPIDYGSASEQTIYPDSIG